MMRNTSLALAAVLAAGTLLQPLSLLAKAQESQANPGVSVDVEVPSDIPLQISDIHATPSPNGLQHLDYALVNTGSQQLTAVQVSWNIRFADGHALRTEDRIDYLFDLDQKVASGGREKLEMGPITAAQHPSPVEQLTGRLTFAEFADGSRLGPDAEKLSPSFTDERARQSNAYRRWFEIYRTGGEQGLEEALRSESASETVIGRPIRLGLLDFERQRGMTALVQELGRLASINYHNPL